MKDHNLQVRMPQAEIAAYQEAAALSGLSVSAWVRDRLRKSARYELQSSGIKVAFIEEKKSE